MNRSAQSFTQVQTVFGGGFVQEQHRDGTHSYLPCAEKHDFRTDLDAVLKVLRSALSLR